MRILSWRALDIRRRFQKRAFGRLQRGIALGRLTRPVLPYLYRSPVLRRLALRDVAHRGDRITAHRAIEFIDDGIGCTVLADLCRAEWQVALLDPLPCPITIAWGGKERLLPAAAYGAIRPLPHATIVTLPNVGHVPMVDDSGLVARTILTTTGALAVDD
jgi:pimeloyl-ACP methyl ester carboxylesterase